MDRATCPICHEPLPDQKQARRLAYNGILVCAGTTCEEAANDLACCAFSSCTRPAVAEGLCSTHYRQATRQRARGEPVKLAPIRERGAPLARVSTRVRPSTLTALGPEPSATLRRLAEEHEGRVEQEPERRGIRMYHRRAGR